mmetsp:Transcript_17275/g.38983  ORF Transcript_17275/g.38983 Transcript_17275/m.38983 type:complete len:197 (-) Transcript_17275:642-1232(-)|eukprot:CAMPEP_0113300560 /NCGR_PEP_ID=MMETSP0010_2-20120614/2137_1 /TAXON_ID=216773 ORGANISM="Corethron hystrix, Strain 308" /NCGR_SAMPLE_ID=MMETSP0010_2 /ASSEMBLY_ACC=CAM_ASM_000155 /LENGTH=196 /DNA_ID=CAMNT_0000154001 /DNA_START=282 /DNA_END=872 /DNA_ORIENTATION=+ /assembly_acc=CAM_ASM_000155
MKLAIFSLLLGAAAAFAPSNQKVTTTAQYASAYENEIGALPPIGFWDPCGLSNGIDQETFDNYRLAELKHGRVAQLCVLGFVVPEFYRFPGELAPGLPFADIPNGIQAINAIPSLGWLQMIFFIGAVDYWGVLGDFTTGKPNLGPEELAKRQTQELQHGRIAMLAVMELLRHNSQNIVSPGFDGNDHLITGLPFLY